MYPTRFPPPTTPIWGIAWKISKVISIIINNISTNPYPHLWWPFCPIFPWFWQWEHIALERGQNSLSHKCYFSHLRFLLYGDIWQQNKYHHGIQHAWKPRIWDITWNICIVIFIWLLLISQHMHARIFGGHHENPHLDTLSSEIDNGNKVQLKVYKICYLISTI